MCQHIQWRVLPICQLWLGFYMSVHTVTCPHMSLWLGFYMSVHTVTCPHMSLWLGFHMSVHTVTCPHMSAVAMLSYVSTYSVVPPYVVVARLSYVGTYDDVFPYATVARLSYVSAYNKVFSLYVSFSLVPVSSIPDGWSNYHDYCLWWWSSRYPASIGGTGYPSHETCKRFMISCALLRFGSSQFYETATSHFKRRLIKLGWLSKLWWDYLNAYATSLSINQISISISQNMLHEARILWGNLTCETVWLS